MGVCDAGAVVEIGVSIVVATVGGIVCAVPGVFGFEVHPLLTMNATKTLREMKQKTYFFIIFCINSFLLLELEDPKRIPR